MLRLVSKSNYFMINASAYYNTITDRQNIVLRFEYLMRLPIYIINYNNYNIYICLDSNIIT